MAERIHCKLLADINDQMEHNSNEYLHFKQMLLSLDGIKKGNLSNCKNLLDMLQLMGTKGHLKPGDYVKLRDKMSESGNMDILPLIDEADRQIKELQGAISRTVPVAAPVQASAVPTVTPAAPYIPLPTQVMDGVKPSGSGQITSTDGTKKRKSDQLGDTDESDVLYFMDNGLGYCNYKPDKKGYLLILEQRDNRPASKFDTAKLRKFFGDELRFEVNDPREDREQDQEREDREQDQDFTKEEFIGILDATKIKLNEHAKEYYCFVCVILSHGNKDGLGMSDKSTISTEEIRKEFTNEKIPKFTGKPKVFLIQACRGRADQDGQDVDEDDESDTEKPETSDSETEDESDEIIRLPHDADTLLAFSTTPGYRSKRRTKSKTGFVGTWFIQKCLEVFMKNQEDGGKRHLEDMLICVRNKVAQCKTKEGAKQMPCIWTTLTNRLRLVKHVKSS